MLGTSRKDEFFWAVISGSGEDENNVGVADSRQKRGGVKNVDHFDGYIVD